MTILSIAGRGTTAALDTTGMTLLAAYVCYDGVPATIISDSKGNTWVAQTLRTDPVWGMKGRWYVCEAPTVGTGHTFTVGNGYASIFVAATDEAIDPTSFDTEAGATSTTVAPTSVSSGAVTGSQASTLHLTAMTLHSFNGTAGPPSIDTAPGWALLQQLNATSGTNYGGGLAYLRKSAATSSTANWSYSAPGDNAATAATLVLKSVAPPPTATLSGSLDTITGAIVAGPAAITADLNGALDSISGNLAVGGSTGRLTSQLPLRDAARVMLANRSDVAVHVLAKPGLGSVLLLSAQSITSGIWTAAGPFTPGQRYNVLYEVGGEPIGCEIITATAP